MPIIGFLFVPLKRWWARGDPPPIPPMPFLLARAYACESCQHVMPPVKHGRCTVCGSQAIYSLARRLVEAGKRLDQLERDYRRLQARYQIAVRILRGYARAQRRLQAATGGHADDDALRVCR